MDLRRKLARLSSAGPGGAPPAGPPDAPAQGGERRDRVAKLQAMIGKLISDGRRKMRDVAPPPEPVALPGETIETPHGPLHRTLSWLEPHHCHGKIRIAGALDVSPHTIAKLALDDGLASVDPRGALFLDTETTGLAGGTGTIPFLVGMAWFEDQSLRVEQLILRKPGEEVPLLRRLAEVMQDRSCIVTYNGKAFDWPLLRNRFVLSRVPIATPRAHLDLLPCARRIFKRRLGQVRLVHLEEEVLGMRRERDIDGAEIPSRFWDFVRIADGSLLAPVIEHNAHDLIALAAILISLAERFDEVRPEHEPADQLGVAQVALRIDDHDRADRWARAAADGGRPERRDRGRARRRRDRGSQARCAPGARAIIIAGARRGRGRAAARGLAPRARQALRAPHAGPRSGAPSRAARVGGRGRRGARSTRRTSRAQDPKARSGARSRLMYRRGVRAIPTLAVLVLCACGARSDLSIGDAGPPFATFPCRWSYGEPLELGFSTERIENVSGAAVANRDEAAVVGDVRGSALGGVVTLSLSPRRVPGVIGGAGRLFSARDGYLVVHEMGCRVARVDRELQRTAMRHSERDGCPGSQTEADRVEIFGLESGVALSIPASETEISEQLFLRAARFDGAQIVRLGERRGIALLRLGASGQIERFGPDGEEQIEIALPGYASLAADRLRGGVVLLREDADGRHTFERFAPQSELRPEVLMSGLVLPGAPVGPIVTNETEALVPLTGGVIAYLPLAATEPRFIEPLPEPVILAMSVFLRPGTSAGGVAYVHRSERGEHLTFRALVCNR